MRTKTLESWLIGIRLSHIGHRRAASHYTRAHKLFGIPVVILTTVAGTAAFSSLGNSPDRMLAVAVGVFSICAAVLSSLQTFLGHSSSAERHKSAACKYGMLRRELEQFLDDNEQSPEVLREFIKNFRVRWDRVDEELPPLGERIHKAAREQLQRALEEDKFRTNNFIDTQEISDTLKTPVYAGR